MLYYVKTGDMETSLYASSHMDAARKSLEGFSGEPGLCVVVSERPIEEDPDRERFFLTENLVKPKFRIVG